ncbi:tripartite tricarboxylate transporter TctB family protein [Roseibaca sp. Y0-43]|uniref:tripartite tricarboxylate transporter TctB family protein n=1 Tax=Roseibaca sp. Y0-43 TaxID=2816854 RepID=UPI001D0CBA0D|nr:tripartite tricarboxylate transporter TctB family protein [Roseibaca sp. Y0-43]MCC1481681.1 tripartite tricarboxylate transporter TctB family protein [Roseibaca sp. Y0-43]
MRQGEISLAGLLALFSIYLMWKATELPIGYISGRGPGGGFWPFWLALGMLLSCMAIAWNWWRRKTPASQSDEPLMDSFGWLTLLNVGGGVVAFVALISVVSMYGAIALFLLYYLRFLGRHSWVLTLTISILLPIGLFFFFEAVMLISMPQGMAFTQPFFDVMYDIIY